MFRRSHTIDSYCTLSAINAVSAPIFGFGLMREVLIGPKTTLYQPGFLATHKDWASAAEYESSLRGKWSNDESDDNREEKKEGEEEETTEEKVAEAEFDGKDPHGEATKELLSNTRINDSEPCISYMRFQAFVREVADENGYRAILYFEPQAFKILYMAWERDIIAAVREMFERDCLRMLYEEWQKKKNLQ